MIRTGENDGRILKQLFVHVDQRRRGGDAVGHAEAQPVRLPVIMIPEIKIATKKRVILKAMHSKSKAKNCMKRMQKAK